MTLSLFFIDFTIDTDYKPFFFKTYTLKYFYHRMSVKCFAETKLYCQYI